MSASAGWGSTEAVFRRFDEDNSGTIDVTELQPALVALGVSTNDLNEAAAVMKQYTTGNTLNIVQFNDL
eukprot:4331333-Prymnesium_polylepis.1